jgi:BolA protein
MRVAQSIEAKLTEALKPVRLVVEDDSARHAGHAGMAGSGHKNGESHFNLEIVSAAFAGRSRVARQRLVYELLKEELAGPVHALSLKTATPEEAGL